MEKFTPDNLVFVNPAAYFDGLVNNALTTLNITVSEHVKFYLVNLLSHFISSENLYPRNAEGKMEDSTLVLKLVEALQASQQYERRMRLKQLGDFSLYIAGFFSYSLNRKLVDVDYYIDMGGSAYLEIANNPGKPHEAEVFAELGSKFPKIVDVLGEVSEESFVNKNDYGSLLRTYDLWAKTGSERLAKQLARAGIVADESQKKNNKQ